MLREVRESDFDGLLALYMQLRLCTGRTEVNESFLPECALCLKMT